MRPKLYDIALTLFATTIYFSKDPEAKDLEDRRNIGPDFPYRRGDTPIFNFDEGDENFLDTIKPLVESLNQMSGIVAKQRRLTQAFGEAFAQCEECG